MILVPDEVRHRIILQPGLNLHLHLHIALIVFFEQRPLVRGVMRQVPCPATVALRRSAGATEILDQFFAFFKFLFFKAEDSTDLLQPQRQTVVCCPDQCAFP